VQLNLFDVPRPKTPDICQNRHGGNAESQKANATTNKSRDCRRVLEYLTEVGSRGATCDEMEVEMGMSHQSCSARCSDLLRDGAIKRKPLGLGYERRVTRTGRSAAVLVLS
jgi:hypothetical protein